MDEYFCPNCGATLNNQPGFDPKGGTWTCTSCGKLLMDDDVCEGDTFEGVAWYCDNCGELLNRQPGFSDAFGSWRCTNCSHVNGTTEGDIINDGPQCPNCGAWLKKQYSFSDWSDDHICSECGTKLHRNNSSDPFEVAEDDEKSKCPGCGTSLKDQYSFSDWYNDYTCSECGAKLHREYSCDPFEIVKEDEGAVCPRCGDHLKNQFLYSEIDNDWCCKECGAKLHRDYSFDNYKETSSDDDDENDQSSDSDESSSGDLSDALVGLFSVALGAGIAAHSRKKQLEREDTRRQAETERLCLEKERKRKARKELRKKRVKAFFFKGKKIAVPCDYEDLIGKNASYVANAFSESAFTDIKTIAVKDIYKGSAYKVGQVEQVIIDGSSYFSKGDLLPYDVEIIITYHEKKEIVVPFSERNLRKMNYIEAGDCLQALGFTEIYEKPIRDLVTGWIKKDGAVEKITIGEENHSFKKNSVFPFDIEIIIEYHTFKKK